MFGLGMFVCLWCLLWVEENERSSTQLSALSGFKALTHRNLIQKVFDLLFYSDNKLIYLFLFYLLIYYLINNIVTN